MKATVIQKLRAPVRLSQPGDSPLDGYFCLLPDLDGQGRPETILELLNSSRRVIPFFRVADDNFVLFTRLNFMPQIGHSAGLVQRICGCMGQE